VLEAIKTGTTGSIGLVISYILYKVITKVWKDSLKREQQLKEDARKREEEIICRAEKREEKMFERDEKLTGHIEKLQESFRQQMEFIKDMNITFRHTLDGVQEDIDDLSGRVDETNQSVREIMRKIDKDN